MTTVTFFSFCQFFFKHHFSTPLRWRPGHVPPCPPLAMPLRWGNALYILNDIISEMFEFGRTMNIKEHYYFNRGPGRSPGKFLKIYACSNFFDAPSLGV